MATVLFPPPGQIPQIAFPERFAPIVLLPCILLHVFLALDRLCRRPASSQLRDEGWGNVTVPTLYTHGLPPSALACTLEVNLHYLDFPPEMWE